MIRILYLLLAGCLLQPSAAAAWLFSEHWRLGSEGFEGACSQLREELTPADEAVRGRRGMVSLREINRPAIVALALESWWIRDTSRPEGPANRGALVGYTQDYPLHFALWKGLQTFYLRPIWASAASPGTATAPPRSWISASACASARPPTGS